MSTATICDKCGKTIGRWDFYIRAEPGQGDGQVLFLDGSWNGGDYCSPKCAAEAIGTLKTAAERMADSEQKPESPPMNPSNVT